jgi:hypothetical protein
MPQLDLFVYPTQIYSIAVLILIGGTFVFATLQQLAFFFVLRRFDFWSFAGFPKRIWLYIYGLAPLLQHVVFQGLASLHFHLLQVLRARGGIN